MTVHRSLILLTSLLLIGAANAQNAPIGFQTPSKNIACQYYDYNGPATLRCDIGETTTTPPRPADCQEEWGRSFEMEAKGGAGRVCAGDTVNDPSLPTLAYGEVWQRGGFTCRSEQSGLTCFNAMQHGFSLSRTAQKVF
jgi:hypothetical protein